MLLASSRQRLDRHDPQQPRRRCIDAGDGRGGPHSIAATVNVEAHALRTCLQHLGRRRQSPTPFARTAIGAGLPLAAKPRAAGRSAPGGWSNRSSPAGGRYALPAIGTVGKDVKTPVFPVVAQHFQHLHGQLRSGVAAAAGIRGGIMIEVQPKQDRQTQRSFSARAANARSPPARPNCGPSWSSPCPGWTGSDRGASPRRKPSVRVCGPKCRPPPGRSHPVQQGSNRSNTAKPKAIQRPAGLANNRWNAAWCLLAREPAGRNHSRHGSPPGE